MGAKSDQADETSLSNRVFMHDAFLSHRVGDGAGKLFEALSDRGCRIWYDNDEQITNRRVIEVMKEQFSSSRMVIAHLSRDFIPSPWTMLEILAALASEQECECTRLVLYTVDRERTADLEDFGFDEPMRRNIGVRRVFDDSSVDELAVFLRQANHGPTTDPSATRHAPLRRRRKLDRLAQALEKLGKDEASHIDDEKPVTPRDRADLYGHLLLDHFRAESGHYVAASYELFGFRCGEAVAAEDGEPRTGPCLAVTRAIGCLAVESERGDDRANAYMLLEMLARHYADKLAARFLRAAIAREHDWTIARCVMPDARGNCEWWPVRLHGVEQERLMSLEQGLSYVEPELRPLLADTVRLKLMGKTNLRVGDLPDEYQVDLELHWLAVVIDAYACEPTTWGSKLTEAGSVGGGGTEIELCMRRLFPIVARQLEPFESGQNENMFIRILNSCEKTIGSLIDVSERNGGRPLSEFNTFFVDYLLPLLGLFVQYGEFDHAVDVASRAITIIGRKLPHEAEAYRALISDCTDARARETPRTSMPLHCEFGRIENSSTSFRNLWPTAASLDYRK
ncbi:hypothetical protein GCM10010520_51370 [Rhizobium viscosum]|uniref:TIR domain-containing protein n=1 Tax=Rhizobium viscosum TaxID=1673 RepID=A0ABR9IZ91_RHIVS|nr:toll/interleukin-1 receptor domain-containing protein [Rhizobium viscosum]MBE1508546.1 hypothetical protein [Rhizobium viscosum]